jgi:SAM-dependent methyltransferase
LLLNRAIPDATVGNENGLSSDHNPRPKTVQFYDEQYYLGLYSAVINDQLTYHLLSLYWREVLFARNSLDISGRVLDFGSGLGQVSAALSNSVCFDFSAFALSELRKRGREVIGNREDIPRGVFDCVLSSHSLEHSPTPYQDLQEFRQYLRPGGRLVLVLPIETRVHPVLKPDWNQHLQGWTFQTITNLLSAAGWTPLTQSVIYSPYFLRTLGKRFSPELAVRGAYIFGRLRRAVPSMLTIAEISHPRGL